MAATIYPHKSVATARSDGDLDTSRHAAFETFGRKVFADGVLDARVKQLIAVAVAHATQCANQIEEHTIAAKRAGATSQDTGRGYMGRDRNAGWSGGCPRDGSPGHASAGRSGRNPYH